ncbi:3806_t:CDS:2, partial [Acaulospora morrowiae]
MPEDKVDFENSTDWRKQVRKKLKKNVVNYYSYSKFHGITRINKGGFSVVYKAECSDFNSIVALKVIKGEYFKKIDDFIRELNIHIKLSSHENILKIYGISYYKNKTLNGIIIYNSIRETPILDTPVRYMLLYEKCWDLKPERRPEIQDVVASLQNINLNLVIHQIHEEIGNPEAFANSNNSTLSASSDESYHNILHSNGTMEDFLSVDNMMEDVSEGFSLDVIENNNSEASSTHSSEEDSSAHSGLSNEVTFLSHSPENIEPVTIIEGATFSTQTTEDIGPVTTNEVENSVAIIQSPANTTDIKENFIRDLYETFVKKIVHGVPNLIVCNDLKKIIKSKDEELTNVLLLLKNRKNYDCLVGFFNAYEYKDFGEAYAYYYNASRMNNDALGHFFVGLCYEKGYGVGKDYKKSLENYQKSADEGNAEAQFKIGTFMFKGLCGNKDKTSAVDWYQISAKKNFKAQICLSRCYREGKGIKKNIEKANDLLKT